MRKERRASVAPPAGADELERQLAEIQRQQAELRQRLRRLRNSSTEVRKLEAKLEKQLGSAKWTVDQIKELQPDWDDVGFYQSVRSVPPKPRGRRRKAAGGEDTGG